MQWDLFCRVIDNFGDIGVCWRLAADLAGARRAVRLAVDDARALGWMAPARQRRRRRSSRWRATARSTAAGDVVVEAFGCDRPAQRVVGHGRRSRAAASINLEYLSAEPYVERSHGLPSPQLSGRAPA